MNRADNFTNQLGQVPVNVHVGHVDMELRSADVMRGVLSYIRFDQLFSAPLYQTLQNTQQTRGLSSAYQSNFFWSYHKFSNKS